MSHSPRHDDSEEGEIRQDSYRYGGGDRGDWDRDRQGLNRSSQMSLHGNSAPRRGGPPPDPRSPRDSSLDTDRLRRELQAMLSRQGRSIDLPRDSATLSQLLHRLTGTTDGGRGGDRGWNRDREYSNIPSQWSGRDRSPERPREDRYLMRPSAADRDRQWQGRETSFRDRSGPPSAMSSIDPSMGGRDAGWRGRGRSYDPPPIPPPRSDSRSGPSRGLLPPGRPSMLPQQQFNDSQGSGRRSRGGSFSGEAEAVDDWRRQQRARLVSGGTAGLRTQARPSSLLNIGSPNARESRLVPGPAGSPPQLRSPLTRDREAVPSTVPSDAQTPLSGQIIASKSPSDEQDELYAVSDGEEGETFNPTTVEVSQPVESNTTDAVTNEQPSEDQDVDTGDAAIIEREDSPMDGLRAELDTLSVSPVVSVLEELERTERSLREQVRGMSHDLEERTRTLTKVQHVIDKIDARAAAKEEQARLSKEERVRIAVAGDTMRQRRRDALAGIQPPNDLVAAYQDAVDEEKQANGGAVAAIWCLHNSAQSLQAASDVLRANRRAAIASCESLGLPVSIPVGLESLHDTSGPASTVLLQDLSALPSQPPVRPAPSALPLWAAREELTDSKRSAVAAIMHQRRQATKARTLALGAAYSLAIDNWDAKLRAQEQAEQDRRLGRVNSSGSLRDVDDVLDSLGAAAKTRSARRRGLSDSPGAALVPGLGMPLGVSQLSAAQALLSGRSNAGDVLRSEWDLQQLLAELEQEDRRQRSREATAAKIPNMLTPDEIAGAAFDPCRNNLWSTHGGGPSCVARRPPSQQCGAGVFGCDCVAACDALTNVVNPWSDMEKLIFMDKFMQFPKDFVRISKYLPNKTAQECTSFYYLTKHVVGYKARLKKQSVALRRRTGRNGFMLARTGAVTLGVVLPKGVSDPPKETGVTRMVSIPHHMSDAQFTVTAIPTVPTQTPKVLQDGKKKKKNKDKDSERSGKDSKDRETPSKLIPQSSPGPGRPVVTSGARLAPAGPTSTFSRAPQMWADRSRGDGGFVLANKATVSPVVPVPVKPATAPVTPAAVVSTPAPPPKPITVSKELASLLGTPVPRTASSPVLRATPNPADDLRKRKREDEAVPMAKWSSSEREEFVRLFKVHGREWTDIAQHLPSKTAAQVKNFYQNNKKLLQLEDIGGPGTPPPSQ